MRQLREADHLHSSPNSSASPMIRVSGKLEDTVLPGGIAIHFLNSGYNTCPLAYSAKCDIDSRNEFGGGKMKSFNMDYSDYVIHSWLCYEISSYRCSPSLGIFCAFLSTTYHRVSHDPLFLFKRDGEQLFNVFLHFIDGNTNAIYLLYSIQKISDEGLQC